MAYLILAKVEGTGVPGTLLADFNVTTGLLAQERLAVDSNDILSVYRMHDRNTSLDTINFKGDRYTLTGTNSGAVFDIFLNNITTGYTLRSVVLYSDDTKIRYTTDARLNTGPSWYTNTMSHAGAGAIWTHTGESELMVYGDSSDNIITVSDNSRNVFLNGSSSADWTFPLDCSAVVCEVDNIGNIYFWKSTTQEIVKIDWATATSTTAYPVGESISPISNQKMDIAGDGTFAVFVADDDIIYKYTFATLQKSALITDYVGNVTPAKIKLTQDDSKLCVLGNYGGSNMRVFSI